MNNYKYFVKKNNLEVLKVTIKDNKVIVDTPLDSFIIIKGDINKYNYLLSRGFDYIPRIIDYDDKYIMFDNLEAVNYDISEKLLDYIRVISLLHIKTSYYKEVNNLEYNFIYEELLSKINDTRNYYESLINGIESREYMSPVEYLIARNISLIFYIINISFDLLEKYYSIVKDKSNIRVVTLYNNDIANVVKTKDSIYLTDFNSSYIDSPIYDILFIYNNYYNYIDLDTILNTYTKVFKLSEEELLLIKILVLLPSKIRLGNGVNDMIISKNMINKIYKSLKILESNKEETSKTKKQEDNE